MVPNQYQVFLELLPSILGTVPKKIGTGTKSNWNSFQKMRKTDYWNQFQVLLVTEPRVIGTENSSKITNNTWYHYQ